MATSKIKSDSINADAIDGTKIADNAINSEHYTDGSIDTVHIADDAIDSEHYADGSIDTVHIADNQITLAKMAGGTDGQIITYDASGDPVAVGPGSDGQVLTSTGAGSPPAFETISAGVDGITTSANATAISISADEEVTLPAQPGFLAYYPGTDSNATGDGTTVNLAGFTEVFDTNADFNASTGIFTAPVTGKYLFVMVFRVTGITSGMWMDFGLNTSNNLFNHLIFGGIHNDAQVTSTIADMDASDTAQMRIICSAGSKVADIIGGNTSTTSFSGFLLG